MRISTSMRWLVVAVSAAMLLAVAAACSSETIEVPGETVVVKEEVIKTVEVPGETVVKEVIKEVMVPGETVVVEKVVTETVEVPGETVVVEKEVVKTVEVPGETVTVEVVKEVQVPGETVVVEKEVVKTVEVPGETVVVEKEVVKTVEVPGATVVVEKQVPVEVVKTVEIVKTVEVPGDTIIKEVVKTVEVPGQKYVTDPTTGKAVVAPQYGGTLTYARQNWGAHADSWYTGGGAASYIGLVNEMLGIGNWGIDRNVWDWRLFIDTPEFAYTGYLAESWDISPDQLTYTFNIRKGVPWHDKAPMNGRELTASDVEYNFQRLTGLGKFSEAGPSPVNRGIAILPIESITATDKYTVVVQLEKLDFSALRELLGPTHTRVAVINPPEVIEEHGDYKDWRNTVGTGPYELTEVVEDSSITWTKNHDYWGYDEKFPENRLPYIDTIRALLMPELATRLSAMRTGKIDILGSPGVTAIRSIDVVESLQKTNPEIPLYSAKFRSDNCFYLLGMERPPMNDIRVRQALQMALDLDTIVATYFKGYGDATPTGHIAGDVPEIGTPFEEWPEEVKMVFDYNPEGAEALLEAAGYPRGGDGVRLNLGMAYFNRYDLSYAELVAGYWRQIGIETEIDVLASGDAAMQVVYEDAAQDTYNMRWGECAYRYSLPGRLRWYFYDGNIGSGGLKDLEFDAIVDSVFEAATLEEQNSRAKAANDYITEKFWKIWGPETPQFQVTQPWIVGFNGEMDLGSTYSQPILARLWIDSELKEAMGR